MPLGPMKPLIEEFNIFNGINWQFWFGCSPIQPLSLLPRVPLCLAPQMLSLEPDLGDAQQPKLCQGEGGQLCGGSHFKEKWPNYYHWYKGCSSPAAPTARHLEPCRLCTCQTHVFLPAAHKKLGSRGLEPRRVFMCVRRCKKSSLWPRCARVREGWALGWLQGGLGPGVTAGVTVTSTYLLVHGEPDTMREALHEVIFVWTGAATWGRTQPTLACCF